MKKFLIGLFCILLSIMLSYSAVNMGIERQKSISLPQFIEFISPIYTKNVEDVMVEGRDGSDITEMFLNNTKINGKMGNYEQVYQFYFDNVKKISYKKTIEQMGPFSDGSMTKTQSQMVGGIVWQESSKDVANIPQDLYLDFFYTITGTIQYDPNTHVISDITSPSISANGVYGANRGHICSINGINKLAREISKDKSSATLESYVSPKADIYYLGGIKLETVKFEELHAKLTIDAN